MVVSDHSPQLLPGVSQMPEISKIAVGAKPIPRQSAVTDTVREPVIQTGYKSSDEPPGQADSTSHDDNRAPTTTTEWWK